MPHRALFRGAPAVDSDMAANAQTVRDFDEAVTRRSFGYPTVEVRSISGRSALMHSRSTFPLS